VVRILDDHPASRSDGLSHRLMQAIELDVVLLECDGNHFGVGFGQWVLARPGTG